MAVFKFTYTESERQKDKFDLVEVPVTDFIANLIARGHRVGPKNGSAIIGATFQPGGRLEKRFVETVTALILDIDGKIKRGNDIVQEAIDPEWMISRLPYKGVAHTSYNHSPTFPKYRIILPLAEAVAPSEFSRIWWWLYEKLEHKVDAACKNPDRLFFLPRCGEGLQQFHWVRGLHGPLLSLNDVPADFVPPVEELYRPEYKRGAHTARREPRRAFHTDAALTLKALSELPVVRWAIENPAAVSREVWRGLATNLAAAVLDDAEAEAEASRIFHDISSPDEDRYDYRTTERTFRDAMRSAREYGPMTYATMAVAGAPDELCNNPLNTGGAKAPIAQARQIVAAQSEFPKAEASAGDAAPVTAPGEAKPALTGIPNIEPVAPVDDDGSDDDDGDDTSGFANKLDAFLYDAEGKGWLIRDARGKWNGPHNDTVFNNILLTSGMPRKKQDAFKMQIKAFMMRKPLYGRPNEQLVVHDGMLVFNTYERTTIIAASGPWDVYRELLLNLVGHDPQGLEYFLDWTAYPIQKVVNEGTSYKMGTAPVLVGQPGSGKNTYGTIMRHLYGGDNVAIIGQDQMDSRFNGAVIDKLFVICDEVMSSTNRSGETANKLKPWITETTIPIEEKFMRARTVENHFNMVFLSNDPRPVIIEPGDRRYTVFKSKRLPSTVAQAIYKDLEGDRAQLKGFYDHLLNRQTTIKYGEIYETEARKAIQRATLPAEVQFCELIEEYGWLSISKPWVDDAPNGKMREAIIGHFDYIESSIIESVYRDWCQRQGFRFRRMTELYEVFRNMFPNFKSTRTRVGGVQARCVSGIPLQPKDAEVLQMPAADQAAPATQAPQDALVTPI